MLQRDIYPVAAPGGAQLAGGAGRRTGTGQARRRRSLCDGDVEPHRQPRAHWERRQQVQRVARRDVVGPARLVDRVVDRSRREQGHDRRAVAGEAFPRHQGQQERHVVVGVVDGVQQAAQQEQQGEQGERVVGRAPPRRPPQRRSAGSPAARSAGAAARASQRGMTRTVTTLCSSPTEITRSSGGASGHTALNGMHPLPGPGSLLGRSGEARGLPSISGTVRQQRDARRNGEQAHAARGRRRERARAAPRSRPTAWSPARGRAVRRRPQLRPRSAASTAPTHSAPPSSSSGCPSRIASQVSGLTRHSAAAATQAAAGWPRRRMRPASARPSSPTAIRHGIVPSW